VIKDVGYGSFKIYNRAIHELFECFPKAKKGKKLSGVFQPLVRVTSLYAEASK